MEINYILCIGRRCNTTDFIRKNNLSKFGSPMDYMFITFPEALKVIKTNFDDFLHDIVVYNKKLNTTTLIHSKNTTKIKEEFFNIHHYLLPYYLNVTYRDKRIMINQNYLPTNITGNLYHWDKMCTWIHHDLDNENIYNSLKNRCDNMINCLKTGKSLLIYSTPIIRNSRSEKKKMMKIIEDNNFEYELFIIMFTSTPYKLGYEKINNTHFYSVLVDPYIKQFDSLGDNDFVNFDSKPILKKVNEIYSINLLEKHE